MQQTKHTRFEFLRKDRWSPYLVGFGIGSLLTLAFAIGHPIGVSGGVTKISLLLERALFPEHSLHTPYLQKFLSDLVLFDWKTLFVVGLFLGSWIASKGTTPSVQKNTIWEAAFGSTRWKRSLAAFVGGMLLLIGARFAGGCTSGHAISGGAQLSIVSWSFMIALFATAIPVSYLLYNRK